MCLHGSHIHSSLSQSPPWKRKGIAREEKAQGNCTGHCSTPTGVHCCSSTYFSVSRELGLLWVSSRVTQQGKGLLESLGTFMYGSTSLRRRKGKMRVQKKSWMVKVVEGVCRTYRGELEESRWFGLERRRLK